MPTNEDQINIKCYRGDTKTTKFMVKDHRGEAYDLSGFDLNCQARLSPNTESTLFDISIVDGEIGSDFENGTVVLRIPSSTTADLPPQAVYDIQATSGDLVITIARGKIILIEDVTR